MKLRIQVLYQAIAVSAVLLAGFHWSAVNAETPAQVSPKPATKDRPQRPPIRPRTICPTDVQPLATALLRDLPSYINRLSHQQKGSQSGFYAIAASPPDFTPLPVATSQFPDAQTNGLHQVFFTVLERQYDTQQAREFQHHHWLFLAHSDRTGWQLAMLYSRRNSYPNPQPVTSPMRETSQEAMGRAIRLWLRDCEAGSVGM